MRMLQYHHSLCPSLSYTINKMSSKVGPAREINPDTYHTYMTASGQLQEKAGSDRLTKQWLNWTPNDKVLTKPIKKYIIYIDKSRNAILSESQKNYVKRHREMGGGVGEYRGIRVGALAIGAGEWIYFAANYRHSLINLTLLYRIT